MSSHWFSSGQRRWKGLPTQIQKTTSTTLKIRFLWALLSWSPKAALSMFAHWETSRWASPCDWTISTFVHLLHFLLGPMSARGPAQVCRDNSTCELKRARSWAVTRPPHWDPVMWRGGYAHQARAAVGGQSSSPNWKWPAALVEYIQRRRRGGGGGGWKTREGRRSRPSSIFCGCEFLRGWGSMEANMEMQKATLTHAYVLPPSHANPCAVM